MSGTFCVGTFRHLKFAVSKLSHDTHGNTAGIEKVFKRYNYDSELTVFLPNSVQARTLPSRNIVRIWNDN